MKAIITVGLGYGDEGKGSIVDYLVRHYNSKWVVRYSGGHQCGHNVVVPNGDHHCFSQFGAGSLAGADTYIDRDVIVDLLALRQEYEHLLKLGHRNVLVINPDCLVTTIYHKLINRAKVQQNTCGLGIGETRKLWLKNIAVQIRDLTKPDLLLSKLWLIREFYETEQYENNLKVKLPSPYRVCDEMYERIKRFDIGDFATCIMDDTVIIFEGAQGIFLNQDIKENGHFVGTWSDVSPRNATELLDFFGIEYTILGVARSYLTRHGGYLRHHYLYDERPDVDHFNKKHPFQGEMQYGPWTQELFDQSIEKVKPDYLAINCLDQKEWKMETNIPILIEGRGSTFKDKYEINNT